MTRTSGALITPRCAPSIRTDTASTMTGRHAPPAVLLLCFLLATPLLAQETIEMDETDQYFNSTSNQTTTMTTTSNATTRIITTPTTTTTPNATTLMISSQKTTTLSPTTLADTTIAVTITSPSPTSSVAPATTPNSASTAVLTTAPNSASTGVTTTSSSPTSTVASTITPTFTSTAATNTTQNFAHTTAPITTETTATKKSTLLLTTPHSTLASVHGSSNVTKTVLTVFAIIIFAALAILLSCFCVRRIQKPQAFHVLSDPDLNDYESGIATMDAVPVDETQFSGPARLTINDYEADGHRDNVQLASADDELLISFDS